MARAVIYHALTREGRFPIMPFMPKKKPVPSKRLKDTEIITPGEPNDEVRLKPFMGIRPGVYLACLYGAALLLLLFLVLIYPGIKNSGSVLVLKTEPAGAAVLVDGAYMDATPCEVFAKRGHRRIELKLPGFLPKQIEKEIEGKLFASAFFPRKIEIREKLETHTPAGAFLDYASEYAAWTFVGEPSAAYQIPLVLSEGAYRLGPGAADPNVREAMEETIIASARYAVTRAGLRDLIRAKTLLDNNGLSPSPLSLLGSAGDAIAFLNDNPQAALWLGATLTGDAQSALAASSWYTDAASGGIAARENTGPGEAKANEYPPASDSGIRAGLLNFRKISGGSMPEFYISETVISAAAWEQFLEQKPEWKIENLSALMKEGRVTEEYLTPADFPGLPAEGVSRISWYAAKAFCEWLSAFLPSQYNSWEVRLPTEAEWEYAAKTPESPNYNPSYGHSYGRFWEWCEDYYAPLNFLSVPAQAAAALSSPERSLRGGSWVNPQGSTGPETRGSLPPSFCSSFVSARPVIAQKKD